MKGNKDCNNCVFKNIYQSGGKKIHNTNILFEIYINFEGIEEICKSFVSEFDTKEFIEKDIVKSKIREDIEFEVAKVKELCTLNFKGEFNTSQEITINVRKIA